MAPSHTIVDADIATLSAALASGALTSVDLVAKYLVRIAEYDCRNQAFNSIPLINEAVFQEAAAADDRRASNHAVGLLDGLPFTVKDSYKVKGLTVASGSEAFEHLVANEDAFSVATLRQSGAILLGKTNMCPMAYGGMLRGVYGRAESPYNSGYLAAAFGSGSSNGSGVSTAASFAAFGMGEETVSSGRSPASNNALVAYTPSRGIISIRGNWPLYPTCDVVVPHTRTVEDLLAILDPLVCKDQITTGDFWRDQGFTSLQIPPQSVPTSSSIKGNADGLRGKRVAVPLMYLKSSAHGPYISESIQPLWDGAEQALKDLGATVELMTEFPIMPTYEEALSKTGSDIGRSLGMPEDWNSVERGELIAQAWEDFLQSNNDEHISSLTEVDYKKIFPQMSLDDPQVKYTEPSNAVQWSKLAEFVRNRPDTSEKSCVYDVNGLQSAVLALEAMRKQYFEKWMDEHEIDFVAFPAVGDVARADSDAQYASAEHAWKNGVKYSHGNRALRHLGIPSVTVPMGTLEPQHMPIGITFLGRAYDDKPIIAAAHAFEKKTLRRLPPPLTPPLPSDTIPDSRKIIYSRPDISVNVSTSASESRENVNVSVEGKVEFTLGCNESSEELKPQIDIFVDGAQAAASDIQVARSDATPSSNLSLTFKYQASISRPPIQDLRNKVAGKIARDSLMVMVTARAGELGWPSGYLKIIHQSDL